MGTDYGIVKLIRRMVEGMGRTIIAVVIGNWLFWITLFMIITTLGGYWKDRRNERQL